MTAPRTYKGNLPAYLDYYASVNNGYTYSMFANMAEANRITTKDGKQWFVGINSMARTMNKSKNTMRAYLKEYATNHMKADHETD